MFESIYDVLFSLSGDPVESLPADLAPELISQTYILYACVSCALAVFLIAFSIWLVFWAVRSFFRGFR